ncbi:uncharacterized protein ISCGN_020869 [Ixodes scapularis]
MDVNIRFSSMKNPTVSIRLCTVIIMQKALRVKLYGLVKAGSTEYLEANSTIHKLKAEVQNQKYSNYDLVFILTKSELVRVVKNTVDSSPQGFAFVGSPCTASKVGVVQDDGFSLIGVTTMAHELAHALGCPHDGEPAPYYLRGAPGSQHCPEKEGFLMSRRVGGPHNENIYRLSQCCQAMIRFVISTNYGSFNADTLESNMRSVPWSRWLRLFENFLLASGANELPPARRQALLLHCLGPEGQRIFDAPPQPTPNSPAAAATADEAGKSSRPDKPDPYDAAILTLTRHFAARCNVRVERQRFRERRQLSGEPAADFALALRELSASCNFAAQADENMCDQFVAGVTCPRLRERLLLEGDTLTFDRAVEIAQLREQAARESEALANPIRRVTSQAPRGRKLTRRNGRGSRRSDSRSRGSPCTRPSRTPASRNSASVVPYSGPNGSAACGNCGTSACDSSRCPARGRTCFGCGRRGHFQKVCRRACHNRGRSSARVHEVVPDEDAASVFSILPVHTDKRTGVYVDDRVTPLASTSPPRVVTFLVDTGSAVSIIGEEHFRSLFQNKVQLSSPRVTLLDFSRQRIPVCGSFCARVAHKKEEALLTFYVTPSGTSLLGLDAVKVLGLQILGAELRCLYTTAEPRAATLASTPSSCPSGTVKPTLVAPSPGLPASLSTEFGHLFSPGLGLAKAVQHKVKIKQSVVPVALKLRCLPLTLRQQVTDELKRLEAADIIERISASKWVSAVVVVHKKDGSIRLCVDLREPNKAVVVDNFPLPHTEELLHALSGARHFSKLDLAAAYHQVLLHPDSRDLTAFITHEGLFRFKRICFGLASAPAAFQQLMTRILHGCSGVLCYIDDIIVFGKTLQEHTENLREVLHRISKAGLKLNEKCVFNSSELSFLGHCVSAEGIAPLQAKVDAIAHAAVPSEPGMLRSFLGLVEYYARFVPRLAEEAEPMRRLLRKGVPFVWDAAADGSFTRVKRLLASHQVLMRNQNFKRHRWNRVHRCMARKETESTYCDDLLESDAHHNVFWTILDYTLCLKTESCRIKKETRLPGDFVSANETCRRKFEASNKPGGYHEDQDKKLEKCILRCRTPPQNLQYWLLEEVAIDGTSCDKSQDSVHASK